MGDEEPGASIFLFLALVLLEMLFYGFWAAIGTLNSKEIMRKTMEDQGDEKVFPQERRSLRLAKILNNPTEYLHTLELAVTLIHLAMGAFCFPVWREHIRSFLVWALRRLEAAKPLGAESLAAKVPDDVLTFAAAAAAGIFLLYILVTFGILLPRRLALRAAQRVAYGCLTPVRLLLILWHPFNRLVTASADLVMGLFGVKRADEENDVTEEIIHMVNEGHEQGLIQASEAEMISNIFDFADKEAQDIMTPRNQIAGVDGDWTLEETLRFLLAAKNSRFPVYEESMDHIIGILHLKDAVFFQGREDTSRTAIKAMDGLLREPYFVPRTKHIDELFKEMQRRKLQMAIVIDEYGQMDGLVAMEDILEEIVGNILDEYDEDVVYIEDKGNGEYVAEGKIPLEELEKRLGIPFEEEDFDTLNGFLISRMDKIPEENEEFELEAYGCYFRILKVEHKMIRSVWIKKRS